MRFRTLISLISILSILMPLASLGQSSPESTPQTGSIETTQDLIARLTSQQRDQYEQAGKAFNSQNYAEAVKIYNLLLKAFLATRSSQSSPPRPPSTQATPQPLSASSSPSLRPAPTTGRPPLS